MGWRYYGEAIEMVQRRFGYFPRVFCWRGHCYKVESVDRCWETRQRGDRPARRFFCVQTTTGVFELYRDLQAGTWHLRRAKLLPAPVPALQAVLPIRAG